MRVLVIVITIISLSGLVFSPTPLFAQETHSVTPRLIEAEVTPGSIVTRTITITNTHPYVINVFPSLHGLVGIDDQQVVPASETPFLEWTELTRAPKRLQPGASTTVNVTFTIGRDTAPGMYQALLGFGQGVDRPTAEAKVVRGTAPGVVVRFTVPEPKVDTAAAVVFKTAPFITSRSQTGITYTVQNPGRLAVIPQGELLFFNNRGAEVATVPINPHSLSLAPGESLQVATTSPVHSLFGRYDVRAHVDLGLPHQSTITLQDSFWYIPWYILLTLFGLLLSLGLFSYRLAHQLVRHHDALHERAVRIPLHVYEGQSPAEEHDINLKT